MSEVGSSEWRWLAVMGVAVVGGCDSRCWPKKGKKSLSKMTLNGLKWILNAFFCFYIYCPHPDPPTYQICMDKSIFFFGFF